MGKEELIKLFKNQIDVLASWDLLMSKAYFLFVKNWQELTKINSTIDENTLFFYVQFSHRRDNVVFKTLIETSPDFEVVIPIKKPSRKETKCKKYYHAQSYGPHQVNEIMQRIGNKKECEYPLDDIMNVYDRKHVLIANDEICNQLKSGIKAEKYSKNKRFGNGQHQQQELKDNYRDNQSVNSVHSSSYSQNRQQNGYHHQNEQNGNALNYQKVVANKANEGHFGNGQHQKNDNNEEALVENECMDIKMIINALNQRDVKMQELEKEVKGLREENKRLKAELNLYKNKF